MEIIVLLTLAIITLSLIWFPQWNLLGRKWQSFWIIALIGATLTWLSSGMSLTFLMEAWSGEGAINPLRILGLFFAFTILAIYLDEVGFIQYLAYLAVKKAGQSQQKLFFVWFMVIAVATTLTANDIVILTLTPFIIYLSRHAKISPIPYLVSQFVSANTWSMLLIIGNPTNIYLASMFDIDFISYVQVMLLPTIVTGIVSYLLLWMIFQRFLREPIATSTMIIKPPHPSYYLGVVMLGIAVGLMAIAQWIGIAMDVLTMGTAIVFILLVNWWYPKTHHLKFTLQRLPYVMIPFFLSMAILVQAMDQLDWTQSMEGFLTLFPPVYSFGIGSFLMSNVINNIPMSLWFANIVSYMEQGQGQLSAIYASIIGSNLGALLTPIGALAGLMWMKILKEKQIIYPFKTFVKYGVFLSPILLGVALWMLDVFSR
jgi:arsenical pump membrane protein